MNDAAAQYRKATARNTEIETFYFIWCRRCNRPKSKYALKKVKNMVDENLPFKKDNADK